MKAFNFTYLDYLWTVSVTFHLIQVFYFTDEVEGSIGMVIFAFGWLGSILYRIRVLF